MQRVTAEKLYRLDQKVALLQHLGGKETVLFAFLPPSGEFSNFGYTFISENEKTNVLQWQYRIRITLL
jgi:hypothetical protein